jgi:hypothetical protein
MCQTQLANIPIGSVLKYTERTVRIRYRLRYLLSATRCVRQIPGDVPVRPATMGHIPGDLPASCEHIPGDVPTPTPPRGHVAPTWHELAKTWNEVAHDVVREVADLE